MAANNIADKIEDQVGLATPDAYQQTTPGEVETGKRLYADGADGKEKEATVRSHHAGASSDTPASSGIPSAMKQHGNVGDAFDPQDETAMGGHVQPATQNTQ